MSTNPKLTEETGALRLFFRHNLWANSNLFHACLSLAATELSYTDSGTYGSIQATLTHLVRSEERYLFFLNGHKAADGTPPDAQPTMTELKERVLRSGQALIKVLDSISPDTAVQVGEAEKGELMPASIVFLQTIYHSNEHRTHVATLLGQLGIKPPPLSGWDFYDQEILGIEPKQD